MSKANLLQSRLNRLGKLIDLKAPPVVLETEKKLIDEAYTVYMEEIQKPVEEKKKN